MNYLPFCGYFFYGATSNAERASFFCSWGLLENAPSAVGSVVTIMMQMNQFLGGVLP